MGCCERCMKFLLMAVNITTLVIGIALAAAGVVIIVKGHVYFPDVAEFSKSFHYPCGVVIGVGVFMILVGSFGCYVAISAKSGLLNCYFFFLFALSLTEIAAAVYGVIQREPLANTVMENIEQWFTNVNFENATELEMVGVSTIQLTFGCCGLEDGPKFWTMWDLNDMVPASCCGARAKPTTQAWFCSRTGEPQLKTNSCSSIIQDLVFKHLLWGVIGTLVGLVLVNSLIMFAAKFLRSSSSYTENDFVYTRYSNHDTSNSFTGKPPSTGVNQTWL